jgi:tetratricopeptide (TPR) repeat protein
MKRYDEAANALKKAAEIEPKNASAHFNLGLTLYNAVVTRKRLSLTKKSSNLDQHWARPISILV